VTPFPKLAVAVDVVAELDLLAHQVGDTSLHEPVKRGLVAIGAGLHDASDIVRIRQPSGVRREDPFRATLHSSPPPGMFGLPKRQCWRCFGNRQKMMTAYYDVLQNK